VRRVANPNQIIREISGKDGVTKTLAPSERKKKKTITTCMYRTYKLEGFSVFYIRRIHELVEKLGTGTLLLHVRKI
jgi:hypothetical protein